MIVYFKHDGKEYPFDDDRLSLAELRFAKREFGVTAGEMLAGFRTLDVDAVLAVFSIALKRGGITVNSIEDLPVDLEDGQGFMKLIESIEAKDQVVPNREEKRVVSRKAAAKG